MATEESFSVNIKWVPGDIQSLRPDWTPEQCESALHDMSRSLQDRSIEMGWDVIHTLLPEEAPAV